jgi:hypothetical protein
VLLSLVAPFINECFRTLAHLIRIAVALRSLHCNYSTVLARHYHPQQQQPQQQPYTYCIVLFTNMGFFTSVKNAGLQTKLRGDIQLLHREIISRKKELGVQLYHLLVTLERGRKSNSVGGLGVQAPMCHARQDSMKVPLDACRADVGVLEDRKDALEQELVHMEANRDRARMARTHSEWAGQAASRVSDTGKEAKMRVQMKLLDREMHQRQELFGLQVYDDIIVANAGTSSSSGGTGGTTGTTGTTATTAGTEKTAKKGMFGGVKAGISNRLSKLSSDEKAIEECIDKAKKDVNFIQTKIDRKEREIAQLDEGSAVA